MPVFGSHTRLNSRDAKPRTAGRRARCILAATTSCCAQTATPSVNQNQNNQNNNQQAGVCLRKQ
jgi:hypothetical protein